MTKRGITFFLLTLVMIVYLFIALPLSANMAREASCREVVIDVAQNNGMSRFVTKEDIDIELGGITKWAVDSPLSKLPLQQIEDRLNSLSIIESVNCVRLANDRIAINVVPMVPVARVFDVDGSRMTSYYINKEGKKLLANERYRIDVPVIVRDSRSTRNAESVLPLLDRIQGDKLWNELVSEMKIDRNGDILIVPSVAGHIINFGDDNAVDDKFDRLFAFYREVMPIKGWNYYDTISVKFANQIVAKIAPGRKYVSVNEYKDEDLDEIIDAGTLETENVSLSDITPKISDMDKKSASTAPATPPAEAPGNSADNNINTEKKPD